MSAFIGNAITIDLMTNSTTSDMAFTAYGNGGELSQEVEAVDVTPYGVTAKRYVPGLADSTFSFHVYYEDTYSGSPQAKLYSISRTEKLWRVRQRGASTGYHEATFSGFISTIEEVLNNDNEAVGADIEIQITSAITHAAQA